jgi:hypothetical protein
MNTAFYFPHVVGYPNQFFDVSLSGVPCRVNVRWNRFDESWYCSVFSSDRTINLASFRLCCGKELVLCRGLKNLGYIGVFDTKNAGDDPTFLGMGDRFKVGYVSRD